MSVEFFEGDKSLGKITNKPFTLDWTAPAGTHTLSAETTHTTLATGTSAAVVFTSNGETGGGGAAGAVLHQRSTAGRAQTLIAPPRALPVAPPSAEPIAPLFPCL